VILREGFLKYADWLLARALVLRETGNIEAAEKYAQRALECLDQANLHEPQETQKADVKAKAKEEAAH
jgi:hypothetical protein